MGYVALPYYSLPRRKTVKRLFKQTAKKAINNLQHADATLTPYLGYLSHAQAYKLSQDLEATAYAKRRKNVNKLILFYDNRNLISELG